MEIFAYIEQQGLILVWETDPVHMSFRDQRGMAFSKQECAQKNYNIKYEGNLISLGPCSRLAFPYATHSIFFCFLSLYTHLTPFIVYTVDTSFLTLAWVRFHQWCTLPKHFLCFHPVSLSYCLPIP